MGADDKHRETNDRIASVLFACNLNAVRSPMAEGLAKDLLGPDVHVESAGVYAAELDPFAEEAMREVGLNISAHASRTFAETDPAGFDVIIALTPEAAREAERIVGETGPHVEAWDAPNPSGAHGGRDQILEAYREVRDLLKRKIAARFGE
ncbi:MAG: low molecular weight phosphatase family protein [Pseudomonadota bacterium]